NPFPTDRMDEVFIASDDTDAKTTVSNLVRAMGFTSVDWGILSAARDIEDVPLKLMPSWKRPAAVVLGLFIFLWIVALFQPHSRLYSTVERNEI
ncbi:Metalloreductase STEAP3, partial [Armadillidium nasatum]